MAASRADAAMVDLADLPVTRHPLEALIPRVWDLQAAVSPYDAAYLALAEGLGAPLLTLGRRLRRAASTSADIRLLS